MRATGGLACADTSMRSSPAARARCIASPVGKTPIFSPSGPMTRTSLARIASFMRTDTFSACVVYLVKPIDGQNYTMGGAKKRALGGRCRARRKDIGEEVTDCRERASYRVERAGYRRRTTGRGRHGDR